MQIENTKDLKMLKKMVEAGASHAARLAKHISDCNEKGEPIEDHIAEELAEVTLELVRVKARLDHVEGEVEGLASE